MVADDAVDDPAAAQAAADVIAELDAPTPPPAKPRLPAVPAIDLVTEEVPSLRRRSKLGVVLAMLSIAGLVAIVWVVLGQQQERADAEAERARRQREADAESERLRAALADPGAIRIRSNPDQATVWLLLGRTTAPGTPPMTSIALPTGGLLQLRVELDGFVPQDRAILASDWTGTGDTREATVEVALAPAPATGAPTLPADPGKPSEAGAQAFTPGRGVVHVSSTPPGAAVWLLVGITNSMELRGIEAGRDYDLRVLKDGYVPGYVRLTQEEWRDGGDDRLPIAAAPKKAVLERTLELIPAPTVAPPKGKRGR
ncbi:MAG: hypothetical protein R2939_05860 [Kofleriaceae bacterium]